MMGSVLKLRVAAPPERGKANAAIEEFIAGVLRLPLSHVRIILGHSAPRKVVEINGLEETEVLRRLSS